MIIQPLQHINQAINSGMEQAITARAHALVETGNKAFGTNIVLDRVEFFKKGKAAGAACRHHGVYFIQMNLEAAGIDIDEALEETLPHEVAHLIIFAMRTQGRSRDRGHGRDWQRVCRYLGGNASRTHTMCLTPARVRRKYLYRLSSGLEIKVSSVIHNRILSGRAYSCKGQRLLPELCIGEIGKV